MKTIIIIQARMGSTRLPGKILLPLGEHDNLVYVTERCKKITNDVIVATSALPQDDEVEAWCKRRGIACYRGAEEDVLDRFVQAAKPYAPDYVIRVTADCPFVDMEMGKEMLDIMKMKQVDIIDLSGEVARGLAVEVISYEALQYIHKHGREQRHREHVTYYAYEHETEFTRTSYVVPNSRAYPKLRITLDTSEDYAVMSKVAEYFNDIFVPSEEVIQYLLYHPEIAKLNAHVEQKPVI